MFDKDNKFGFINNNNENSNNNINEMHNPYQNLKPFMTNGNFAYFDITNLKVGAYTPYQDIPQTAWVFQVTNKAGIKQTWFSSTKSRGCFIIVNSFNKTTDMVNVLYLIDTVVGMEYKQLIYDASNDIFTFNKERRILLTNNTTEYTPTKKYHPTTKKYVDDKFICTDIVENVGTIPKEEMQKCNNGTSRYVSSIKFKEFFADYEYYVYQGTYGDKNIRMIYDAEYNRILAYDLDSIDKYDITLGFEFNNNYMYPFNGGAPQVKSYQFTNDLVITKSPILNPSEIYSKGLREYVGTKENPVLFTEIKNGWNIVKNYYKWYAEYENSIPCGTMLVHKCPAGKNFYITYMNGAELTRYGYNATTHVVKGYNHVLSNEVLTTDNTIEYTPTTDYHPATKKYVDDNRDYYFKTPTILYDDPNLPKGYVDIITLEQGTNYRVNSSIVSGFFKVSLKAPNDDGTWFTVDDGSNTIGWSSMLSTSICVQLKSNTFIAINMNCINNYCKYLSITKENGKWKLMQTKLVSISPDNMYEYDVTNDYNPAHKKYVDDKVSSLPQFSFNENGELVVKIGDTTKIFVPKE